MKNPTNLFGWLTKLNGEDWILPCAFTGHHLRFEDGTEYHVYDYVHIDLGDQTIIYRFAREVEKHERYAT